ncbi:small acid-soluble spore protein Tlp [Oceanobacillus chungangensis]|uniref:Small, acid-soluble spore protein Tlp n=1 Tax=Oceanobacillus chungangensis TaxID=1229152 RepID=A0A3D8PNR0_9BACI|nr:small acid-soluble spore protein Tlp [Oceanobacillus chungangensis]RDW17743.1 small acid-soluble spore protein Tlp [Oceanobacillus chungangensis]
MTNNFRKPNPDDRSDNAGKLQSMIQNTIENMDEANETMQFSDGVEKEQIIAKNKRREQAIEVMREEIQDES